MPLFVMGGPGGPARARAAEANDSSRLLGRLPVAELKADMAACKALIFPGEEECGIVPVEVMASGRPVIALGRGGALDTVIDRQTGLLFEEASVDGLVAAVEDFEREGLEHLDPRALVRHAALHQRQGRHRRLSGGPAIPPNTGRR